MASSMKIGLVGVGKIARDQHLPVLARSADFTLVAAASRNASVDGIPAYRRLEEMLDGAADLAAVSLCTPPVGRAADARLALDRGVAVMLEKPPTATLAEAEALVAYAAERNTSLYFTWHSRHAAGVAAARAWLRDKTIEKVSIDWLEDVRVWHPGQDWILQAGGLGVFDPGINALSVATEILPLTFALEHGLLTFPSNRQAPIAAELLFRTWNGAPVDVRFDFLHEGRQRWDIAVETNAGRLTLTDGGARAFVEGACLETGVQDTPLHGEYTALYRRFADLVAAGRCETDLSPLRHVADSFLLGERAIGPPFEF